MDRAFSFFIKHTSSAWIAWKFRPRRIAFDCWREKKYVRLVNPPVHHEVFGEQILERHFKMFRHQLRFTKGKPSRLLLARGTAVSTFTITRLFLHVVVLSTCSQRLAASGDVFTNSEAYWQYWQPHTGRSSTPASFSTA